MTGTSLPTPRVRAERFITACRQMAQEGTGARLAVDRVSDAEGGYEQPDDGRGRGEPVWAGEFMSAAASPGDVRLTEVVLHRAADRDRDGHPELTDAMKERVLGVHAAELFGLDPDATRCGLAADMPAVSRPAQRELAAACELPAQWVPPGPVSQEMQRGRAQENGPWIPRLRLV